MNRTAWRIAVVGAGPVGLALALHGARLQPEASFTVFDARPADRDVAADPRTLALAAGSVAFLERLRCWPAAAAAPITSVHVSQAPPSPGEPAVLIEAAALGVPQLGAVLSYGALVAPLQRAWEAAVRAEPRRLAMRFGTAVAALQPQGAQVLVQPPDAAPPEAFDLAVVAEGGLFAEQMRRPLHADYRQTAWVGTLVLEGAVRGRAYERFTPQGPVALLPLPELPGQPGSPGAAGGRQRAALVWCVSSGDDPVRALGAGQRRTVLQTLLPAEAGHIVELSPLKDFALGLNAARTLVEGRTVRIGNAAQTLHPVAGQGLNLGLRDAYVLVDALRDADDVERALRRVEWARAPDRWSMIAATDFLARSFTWRAPGAAGLRAAALSALQAAPWLKRALAEQMMFGRR